MNGSVYLTSLPLPSELTVRCSEASQCREVIVAVGAFQTGGALPVVDAPAVVGAGRRRGAAPVERHHAAPVPRRLQSAARAVSVAVLLTERHH